MKSAGITVEAMSAVSSISRDVNGSVRNILPPKYTISI